MRIAALTIAGALALGTAGTAGASVVFSDTFNYGSTTVLNAGSSVFGGNWTISNGTVDYLAQGSSFGSLCTTASNCVDLDGSTRSSGLFATTMTFGPGKYLVSFDMTGSGRGTTETGSVMLGSASYGYNLGSSDVLHGSFWATVTGAPVSLAFQNAGGDNVGAILQSVSVSTVPVPAAGVMLLAGLGALGALRRKRAQG